MKNRNPKGMKFSDFVALSRISKGYTQEHLAKLVSVSKYHISKIEGGKHRPSMRLFYDINCIFGSNAVELKEFLFLIAIKNIL